MDQAVIDLVKEATKDVSFVSGKSHTIRLYSAPKDLLLFITLICFSTPYHMEYGSVARAVNVTSSFWFLSRKIQVTAAVRVPSFSYTLDADDVACQITKHVQCGLDELILAHESMMVVVCAIAEFHDLPTDLVKELHKFLY